MLGKGSHPMTVSAGRVNVNNLTVTGTQASPVTASTP